jgi:transposase InsO family protein
VQSAVYDNSVAESLFATLKTELIYRRTWPSRRPAKSAVFEFIAGWYNQNRRHSSLGYLSPADVERRTSQISLAA